LNQFKVRDIGRRNNASHRRSCDGRRRAVFVLSFAALGYLGREI
jgi:hypothetical protein